MMNWIATTIEQTKIASLILSLYILVINLLWVNCTLSNDRNLKKKDLKFFKRDSWIKNSIIGILYVKHSIFFRKDNTPFNLLISLLYIYSRKLKNLWSRFTIFNTLTFKFPILFFLYYVFKSFYRRIMIRLYFFLVIYLAIIIIYM